MYVSIYVVKNVTKRRKRGWVKHVRKRLNLSNSSAPSFMICPRSEGGLEILNPSALYGVKHLYVLQAVCPEQR